MTDGNTDGEGPQQPAANRAEARKVDTEKAMAEAKMAIDAAAKVTQKRKAGEEGAPDGINKPVDSDGDLDLVAGDEE